MIKRRKPRHAAPVSGERFGGWTVASLAVDVRSGRAFWWCRCDCGREQFVSSTALRVGRSKRCRACAVTVLRSAGTAERFWGFVETGAVDDCWPWKGRSKKSFGYGQLRFRGRTHHAHRVAWTLGVGEIPTGRHVCHRCDNPPCCNPAHLFLGTHRDNMDDKVAKGRQARGATLSAALIGRVPSGDDHFWRRHPEQVRFGEESGNTQLTWAIVREIRRRYAAGESQQSIADSVGSARTTISYIVRGLTWQEERRRA